MLDNLDSKIPAAKWYLKNGKTKKFVCEYLGIPYNIKKLEALIEAFDAAKIKEQKLRDTNKKKVFSEDEKKSIAKDYLEGNSQQAIANRYFITTNRVKKILLELQVPIRTRKKADSASVEHIIQDLDVKFSKNDKVFVAKYSCYAIIDNVYDEDYLDILESGALYYVELLPQPRVPVEGVHYEIYSRLDNGQTLKLSAVQNLINNINKHLEKTGREYYKVWLLGDYSSFQYCSRDELFPVRM